MQLSNNQQAFLAFLRAGLWSDFEFTNLRNYGFVEPVDWDEVYRLAEEQSVIGVVLAGIEHSYVKPPQELLLQWIGEVQMLEQQNKAMNQFIAELVERLRKVDIYTLLVKGQGIAQCYEKPLWRASGDIDLLLDAPNYEKAKVFALPLASSIETERGKHLGMTIDTWVVELHGYLFCWLSKKIDRVIQDVQDDTFLRGGVRVWKNDETEVMLPNPDNDAIFIFTHFLKHFYHGGLGLRQICDWCRLLWTFRSELDLRLLESRIRKAGLMSEWKAFYNLASRYLGMPDYDSRLMVNGSWLISCDSRFDKKADRIMEFVLKSGNMGHNRDMSHFSKYPYLIRKCVSMGRRIGDLINHARIFPLDSLRFFPRIMFNGVRSAMKGEG